MQALQPTRRPWVIPAIVAAILFLGGVPITLVAGYVQSRFDPYKRWVWISFGIALVVAIVAAISQTRRLTHLPASGSNARADNLLIATGSAVVHGQVEGTIRSNTIDNAIIRGTDNFTIFNSQITGGVYVHAAAKPSATAQFQRRASRAFSVPRRHTLLVGRDWEIEQTEILLKQGGQRAVVGLFGMAAVGKTAIACELCYRLRSFYRDGIVFSSLESQSLESVIDDLALKFSLAYSPALSGPEKAIRLQSRLSNKKVLIVLDNADDWKPLEELLNVLSNSSLIITSRKRFTSNSIIPVSIDRLSRQAAISLFQKAAAIDVLAQEQTQLVSEICELVGDLPLAIRLEAARIQLSGSSVRTIVQELKQGGLSELEPALKDQSSLSIRFAFDKSFDALDEVNKELFGTLGAFPGASFTLNAIRACTEIADCKRRLDQFVALSMVQIPYEGRYSLHPLLKLYAQEQIKDTSIRGRVANYYIDLIQHGLVSIGDEMPNVFGAIEQYQQADLWAKGIGHQVITNLVERLETSDTRGRMVIVTALIRIGEPGINQLVAYLNGGSPSIKYYAASVLGSIGHPKAEDSLLLALADKDATVQRSAIGALGKLKSKKAVSRLIDMLGSKRADVRAAAKEALLIIRNPAIDPLIQGLYHGNVFVQYHAVEILGEIQTPRAIPGLIGLLGSGLRMPAWTDNMLGHAGSITPIITALTQIGLLAAQELISVIEENVSGPIAERSMKALTMIGIPARGPLLLTIGKADGTPNPLLIEALKEIGDHRDIEELLDDLQSKDDKTRSKAARKLGRIGASRTVEPLVCALRDKSGLVRAAAAEALGEMKANQATIALGELLSDKSSDVRYHALEALGRLATGEAIDFVIAGRKDKSELVRVTVAKLLGQIKTPAGQLVLIELLKDKNHIVRAAACKALGDIGDRIGAKALLTVLREQNSTVAFYAAEALGKIADLRVLPELEYLALRDKREMVDTRSVAFAAAQACEKIRGRTMEGY